MTEENTERIHVHLSETQVFLVHRPDPGEVRVDVYVRRRRYTYDVGALRSDHLRSMTSLTEKDKQTEGLLVHIVVTVTWTRNGLPGLTNVGEVDPVSSTTRSTRREGRSSTYKSFDPSHPSSDTDLTVTNSQKNRIQIVKQSIFTKNLTPYEKQVKSLKTLPIKTIKTGLSSNEKLFC